LNKDFPNNGKVKKEPFLYDLTRCRSKFVVLYEKQVLMKYPDYV